MLRRGGLPGQGSIAGRKQNVRPGRKHPERCQGAVHPEMEHDYL